MNGREIFRKYSSELSLLEGVYNLLPEILINTISSITPSNKVRLLLRYYEIRKSGKKIGENVYIAENVVLKNSQGLTIGSNFSLHEFSYIDAIGGIEIGDNVSIAHNCSLVSFEHTWNDRETPIKYNSTINHPIFIGDDVWIGCGVRVLSGAVIENRVVVAAGAVVKGTLEAGYLYGGIPARKLKKL